MKSRKGIVCGMLLGSVVVSVGQDDLAGLRKELEAMRGEYEARIDRLESRIRDLEAQGAHSGSRVRPSPIPATPDAELESARERENRAMATQAAARKALDKHFAENTETRDLARRADAENMLAERIEDVLEGFLDINGYFRAGYGRSDEGGPQRAFGAPGVAKYRLGNEAENYGELAFAKTFYPAGAFAGQGIDERDPVARMTYRLSFYNPYSNYSSAPDTDFASPELWGSLANVIPGMPGAKIWAGNRFYRRHDIHINDFYFWDMSGGGGGVEDLPLGPGKLAFAWIGSGSESSIYDLIGVPDPDNVAGFSKSSFDLRYYDWAFLGGTGEIGLTYSSEQSGVDQSGRQVDDSRGFALDLVRTDTGFLDENSLHKTSLQFGTGPAKTFTSGFETFSDSTGTYIRPDPDESWRFRATDQIVVKPFEAFSIGGAFVYQYTEFGDHLPSQQWLSGGLRPIWHITDTFNIAFEGGVDWLSNTRNGNDGAIGKLTLAPQVALGDQFFSRPVLRAFVTYANWSDGLRGEVGGGDYANRTSGWSWGLQMESWW